MFRICPAPGRLSQLIEVSKVAMRFGKIFIVTIVWASFASPSWAGRLPNGFVYLHDVVPDIRQEIRYAGPDNFMRRRLAGYRAPECVLTQKAALALGKVQKKAVRNGYSLVVFDCYRPQRAVDAMVAWVHAGSGIDPEYYPRVSRNRLIQQGYIGAKSSHARGSTVDLALEKTKSSEPEDLSSVACERQDWGTSNFGTPFDCFDPASQTNSQAVSQSARNMRQRLVELMRSGGFKNYSGEWWHFTLNNEPFPGKSFDFTIEPRDR
jgi:zinc D-Ala-D-Ala dipeptidase